jgi:hypothetical protein
MFHCICCSLYIYSTEHKSLRWLELLIASSLIQKCLLVLWFSNFQFHWPIRNSVIINNVCYIMLEPYQTKTATEWIENWIETTTLWFDCIAMYCFTPIDYFRHFTIKTKIILNSHKQSVVLIILYFSTPISFFKILFFHN